MFQKLRELKQKSNAGSKGKEKQDKKEQEAKQIEKVTEVTYKITKGEDTRDMSELWVVRINENLNKQDYVEQNKKCVILAAITVNLSMDLFLDMIQAKN